MNPLLSPCLCFCQWQKLETTASLFFLFSSVQSHFHTVRTQSLLLPRYSCLTDIPMDEWQKNNPATLTADALLLVTSKAVTFCACPLSPPCNLEFSFLPPQKTQGSTLSTYTIDRYSGPPHPHKPPWETVHSGTPAKPAT